MANASVPGGKISSPVALLAEPNAAPLREE